MVGHTGGGGGPAHPQTTVVNPGRDPTSDQRQGSPRVWESSVLKSTRGHSSLSMSELCDVRQIKLLNSHGGDPSYTVLENSMFLVLFCFSMLGIQPKDSRPLNDITRLLIFYFETSFLRCPGWP